MPAPLYLGGSVNRYAADPQAVSIDAAADYAIATALTDLVDTDENPTATLGGDAMTRRRVTNAGVGAFRVLHTFDRVAPLTGSRQFDIAGLSDTAYHQHVVSLGGVDGATPVRAVADVVQASGGSAFVEASVSSSADDLLVGLLFVRQGTGITVSGAGTAQVRTQNVTDDVLLAIVTQPGGAGTQAVRVNFASTPINTVMFVVLSVQGAGGGGTSSSSASEAFTRTEAATLGLGLPVATESLARTDTFSIQVDGGSVPGPGTGNLVAAPVPLVLPAQPSPLVVWGTPDSFSGWSDAGTTRTTGQADPWGGTTAMTLAESSANGWAGSATWVASRAGAGPAVCVWLKQQGGSTQTTLVQLWDATAGTARAQGTVTWSGANLASYAQQAGTMLPPLSVGGGWWLVRFVGTGTVAGNTMRLVIYPGSASIRVAARPTVLLGPLDTVRAWAQAREGSTRVRGASGVEDGWDYGRDYVLSGRIRRAASFDLAEPEPLSGWDGGSAEHPAVGYGLSRMFADGQVGTEFRVSPHYQQAATVQVTAWLGDVTGEPANEDNGTLGADVAFRALVPWTGVLA